MRGSRLRRASLLCIGVTATLSVGGCKPSVPKSKMEEAAAWTTQMCACAEKPKEDAKTCAAKLTEPKNPGAETSLFGGPKYDLDSMLSYRDVHSPGEACETKIKLME